MASVSLVILVYKWTVCYSSVPFWSIKYVLFCYRKKNKKEETSREKSCENEGCGSGRLCYDAK